MGISVKDCVGEYYLVDAWMTSYDDQGGLIALSWVADFVGVKRQAVYKRIWSGRLKVVSIPLHGRACCKAVTRKQCIEWISEIEARNRRYELSEQKRRENK